MKPVRIGTASVRVWSRSIAFACATTVAFIVSPTLAADPAAALEQLKQGYALKEVGQCDQAIPHFLESQRLDPKPKTLLNLADCEGRTRELVAAQKHATEARDLARQESNTQMLEIAEQRLAELDKRLPRLTITVARGAPPGVTVSRDGTVLGSVSVGVALPTNPGPHVVVVSAPGHADRAFDVALVEGTHLAIEVQAGPTRGAPSPPPGPPPPTEEPHRSRWTTRTVGSVALAGAGVAGVSVGLAFGFMAISKKEDSNANGHCDATGCDGTGAQLRNEALRDATISTIVVGVGLAAVIGSVVLWMTDPRARAKTVGAHFGPSIGAGRRGLSVTGMW